MALQRAQVDPEPRASAGDDAPSFRTRRGRCYVTDDELVLDSSLLGLFRRLYEGNKLIFAGYVAALIAPVVALTVGDRTPALLGLAAALALLALARVVKRLRGFTADDRIPIDAIELVSAVSGTKGLTRPRFVVKYRRDGAEKRRYILMPSRYLSYGEAAFERAEQLLRERGIPVE